MKYWFVTHFHRFGLKLLTLHGVLLASAMAADVVFTIAGAYAVYRYERRIAIEPARFPRFIRYLLPKEVFFHRSAWLDYQMSLLQLVVGFPFSLPGLIGLSTIGAFVAGGTAAAHPGQLVPMLACAAILSVAVDFSFYAGHVVQHKVPFFWEFHKVHHSAEVLTPSTLERTHPVQDFPTIFFMTMLYAMILIGFSRLYPINIAATVPLSFDILLWTRVLLFFRLRHSHIPMFFPRWATLLFFSPVHHQTHHSSLERHFDRNYGLNLIIWDRLFGTLVEPEHPSAYRLGLSGYEERSLNRSIFHLYLLPFKNAWPRLMQQKLTPPRETAAPQSKEVLFFARKTQKTLIS